MRQSGREWEKSDGARGGTRTLTMFSRRILSPLRLPFRHPGNVTMHDAKTSYYAKKGFSLVQTAKKGGGRLSTPPLKEIPENQQRGEALPIQLLNQSRPRGTDEPNTITN